MAKLASVNGLPGNGAIAIFDMVAFLVTVGWIVEEDSDGTTHEADVPGNGRQTTSGGAGANGLDNVEAWIRMSDPSGARELTLQRLTNAQVWRVKYSALDKFVGGTPGPTETPSALDQAIVHGGGTDAAPTGLTLFNTPGVGIGRWHIVAFDNANSRGVYSFWAFATDVAGSAVDTGIMMNAIDPSTIPPLVGTRAVPITGDADPVVMMVGYLSGGGVYRNRDNVGWGQVTTSLLRAWYAYNDTNGNAEAFVSHNGAHDQIGAGVGFNPGFSAGVGVGSSPYDDADEGFPIMVGRSVWHVTQVGYKGYLEHIRMKGAARNYPDTINLAADAYVYIDDMLIPWPNGVVPLN